MIAAVPNGEEYAPFAGGKGWVASKYTKEPELAEKWLEYAANDANAYAFYEDTNEVPANTAARKKAASQTFFSPVSSSFFILEATHPSPPAKGAYSSPFGNVGMGAAP